MTNFDNIVSDVKVVAGEVGKKAGEYVEISRLRLERITIKGDIQKNFSKIGELIYNGHKSGEQGDEVIGIYLDEIDDQYVRLSEIAKRIAELKRLAHCPVCGAQNEVGSAYCSKCGAKLGAEPAGSPEAEAAEDVAKDVAEAVTETAEHIAEEIKGEDADEN